VGEKLCKIELFKRILNCAKENLTTEELYKLLLATDNEGRTVWEVVGSYGVLNSSQKIWN
jgi:hypothetical protein